MSKRPTPAKSRQKRSSKPPKVETPKASPNKSPLKDSDPKKSRFNPETLDRTVIAIPLLRDLEEERLGTKPPKVHSVIIDLNLNFPGGRNQARKYVMHKLQEILEALGDERNPKERIREEIGAIEQYIFAKLGGEAIRRLVSADGEADPLKKEIIEESIGGLVGKQVKSVSVKKTPQGKMPFARAIYHIWPDFPIRRLTSRSISTVKADAARASFSAFGQGIVWAVLDSGIEFNHRHFKLHHNLEPDLPLKHYDFTGENITDSDPYGHGTHVAGIIAGEARLDDASTVKKEDSKSKSSKKGRAKPPKEILAAVRNRSETGGTTYSKVSLPVISGMAPKCKLVNMRVLDADGEGEVSSIIAAIAKIQEINGYGRRLLIHGVNISVGNDFEPEWFACGQSPLCVEVDRLVKSGVIVVVAAGNSGYGSLQSEFTGTINMGMALTINDPGNAELAITVGATHREMPHMYGVSYFSSKGPTGDGRLKPDLVAPGEKIISCAAGKSRAEVEEEAEGADEFEYIENSGTSMAAPHVSGVLAAFLSVRREFIGKPDQVKKIFLSTATDLGRERYFQGNGLVDLMRAIQSV